ncbi:alpha/beta fold hydrolase [Catenovulum sp. 2E275]|uniref:alpha/beta fold hydrolase n=1 Tax=Catenovulum sp. 2E275 TaxID=2980497 RepID=UPI0021D133E8|nr:alpha/beta fold hydrolase [Catenovulum sp. 2E275]MCU4677398.1 alpha/beta fold hydrolase [Catenovulum sp. 2E275]
MNTQELLSHRENYWPEFYNQIIAPFWAQHCQHACFKTQDSINLRYALIEQEQSKGLVILLPGRVETYLKYQEVIYDLYQAGFSIFTLDHRGQGMSSRMLANPEKGYVKSFDDYADDLQLILEANKLLEKYPKVHCLAHSMGGAIALNWIDLYQPKLQSLLLCAPMLGINAGPLSQKAAYYVAKFTYLVNSIFCTEPAFFIGQHAYFKQKFANNLLCNSQARFNFAHSLQSQHKLGGVTTKWLEQALIVINKAPKIAQKLSYPTLLLQAENELVVSKKSQDLWVKSAQVAGVNCTKQVIPQAKHEILMESDAIRQPAMHSIIQFLSNVD